MLLHTDESIEVIEIFNKCGYCDKVLKSLMSMKVCVHRTHVSLKLKCPERERDNENNSIP